LSPGVHATTVRIPRSPAPLIDEDKRAHMATGSIDE